MTEREYKITIPNMPLYSNITSILSIWNNIKKESIKSTINAIFSQIGTNENPMDWSNPENWIPQRLSGEEMEIALKVWLDSKQSINPRYMHLLYNFINTHKLLEVDKNGIFHISKKGEKFLNGDQKSIFEIDNKEGIIDVLNILSIKKGAKIRDMMPDWEDFIKYNFRLGQAKTSQEMLRSRLFNLIERGFIVKDRGAYTITETGLNYRKSFDTGSFPKERELKQLAKQNTKQSIEEYNQSQRKAFHEKLSRINPFQFEHLIKNLLEQMGYENVVVTKQSGDQGVDVVGTVQIGISTITEVVQVKRHRANISRSVIDQLRGALPYFKAIRGTIITTGRFSKGCEQAAFFPGAAPITLIDGDRLIDLLIDYQIGIRRQPVDFLEIDDIFFRLKEEEDKGIRE
ncbi:MAG: restriction endonuclease [Prolixibacteraceae bacterium]|nr:restriction endonuclease [Prolixibacteraceae bacterium]